MSRDTDGSVLCQSKVIQVKKEGEVKLEFVSPHCEEKYQISFFLNLMKLAMPRLSINGVLNFRAMCSVHCTTSFFQFYRQPSQGLDCYLRRSPGHRVARVVVVLLLVVVICTFRLS